MNVMYIHEIKIISQLMRLLSTQASAPSSSNSAFVIHKLRIASMEAIILPPDHAAFVLGVFLDLCLLRAIFGLFGVCSFCFLTNSNILQFGQPCAKHDTNG